jgi:hypothetical protein
LTDVCLENNVSEVHYLKIDVEGSEAAVLNGIDFSLIRPWIVLVESTLPRSQVEDYEGWEPILLNNDYHYVYFDGLNRFYVADEHQELDVSFRTPPNWWDVFETFKEHKLSVQLQDQAAALRELEGKMHTLTYSRSWRITLPLRAANKYLRSLRKRFLED